MTSTISFSEDLKHGNIDTWNKILNHRFIIEISNDTLPMSKFIFYLKQDQLFLESFSNLLATAATVASDEDTRVWFQGLVESTTICEMQMQDEILGNLEGDRGIIEVSARQTTRDYISYMKSVSDSKDLAIILSAMAPCPWTYYEISEILINNEIKTGAFKKWIGFYSSKESLQQVNETRQLLDNLGSEADEIKKITMKKYFTSSCNHELDFWNMAYSYMQ
jgi:thiaminase/transcriptional activator TenA